MCSPGGADCSNPSSPCTLTPTASQERGAQLPGHAQAPSPALLQELRVQKWHLSLPQGMSSSHFTLKTLVPGTVTRARPPREGPKCHQHFHVHFGCLGHGLGMEPRAVQFPGCGEEMPSAPRAAPALARPCLARNAKSCCPPSCGPFLCLGVVRRMQRGVGAALQ